MIKYLFITVLHEVRVFVYFRGNTLVELKRQENQENIQGFKESSLLPWEVCIYYHAQVLTGSMCVYTSYIVPHAGAAKSGHKGFRDPVGVGWGETETAAR